MMYLFIKLSLGKAIRRVFAFCGSLHKIITLGLIGKGKILGMSYYIIVAMINYNYNINIIITYIRAFHEPNPK